MAQAAYEPQKGRATESLEVAETLDEMGVAARARNDHIAARKHYQRAVAVREQHLGCDHPQVAATLLEVARLNTPREMASNLELARRALAIYERRSLGTHWLAAEALAVIGELELGVARPQAAREALERALAIMERAGTFEGPSPVLLLGRLTEASRKLGDEAGAAEFDRRRDELRQRTCATRPGSDRAQAVRPRT